MRPRIDPSPALLRAATEQDGVITAAQAAEHGLGRHSIARLVAGGQWQSLDSGLYVVEPGEPRWESLAWAGVLLGGTTARLGGMAAAHLHHLVDEQPRRILVLTEQGHRRVSRGPWRFRREHPAVHERSTRGSPPRITVEECVLDLCDHRSDDPGHRSATHWITTAVQRSLTTTERLRDALDRRRLIRDRPLLTDLLLDVNEGAVTPLELRYLRGVERAHGLPRGTRQARRATGALESGSVAVRDLLYAEFRLVVELDGRLGHVESGRLRDLRRDNESALRGERTLRYGWLDVTDDGCLTAVQVGAMLQRCGWTGSVTRCPRCAPPGDTGEMAPVAG